MDSFTVFNGFAGMNNPSEKFSTNRSPKLLNTAVFTSTPLVISLATLAMKVGLTSVRDAASVEFFAAQALNFPADLPTLVPATFSTALVATLAAFEDTILPLKSIALSTILVLERDFTSELAPIFLPAMVAPPLIAVLPSPTRPPVRANSVMKPIDCPMPYPTLNDVFVALDNSS